MPKEGTLLKTLLQKRGLKDKEEIERFLNPSYERDFFDPFLMRDMARACKRIKEAIEKEEKIVIYADYDSDGIPGAVILADFFEKINYSNFSVYIPERNTEGYGLNQVALEQFVKEEVKLIITVDLGTTAVSEVSFAKEKGMEIIITDHHLPPEKLPEAFALLNPKTDAYPEKMLSGAGVAFKLVQGLISQFPELIKPGWEKWLLDLAGLATLADLVPLLGENRAIAYFGMKVLRKSPRPGLQKLLEKMKINQRYLTPDDLGYMVTPKLNAASRMESPQLAYELLATKDEARAGALAEHLAKINDERKTIVTSILREVNKNFEKRKITAEMKEVLVIGNPKWRVGVLGLVASRVAETYERPVFVWGADENDCLRGSCRSDGSVSVVELMRETQDSFLEFGGHEMAGGFSVSREKVHFLEETLSLAFQKVKKEKSSTGPEFDLELSLGEVNLKNWRDLERMEPFGLGNPKPVFLFKKVWAEKVKKFGKNGSGEHLEITFSDRNGKQVKAISFFSDLDSFSVQSSVFQTKKLVDLLASFDATRFRGREELRLRIVDII